MFVFVDYSTETDLSTEREVFDPVGFKGLGTWGVYHWR